MIFNGPNEREGNMLGPGKRDTGESFAWGEPSRSSAVNVGVSSVKYSKI